MSTRTVRRRLSNNLNALDASKHAELANQLVLSNGRWETANEDATIICHLPQTRQLRLERNSARTRAVCWRYRLAVQSATYISRHCWLLQPIVVRVAESLEHISMKPGLRRSCYLQPGHRGNPESRRTSPKCPPGDETSLCQFVCCTKASRLPHKGTVAVEPPPRGLGRPRSWIRRGILGSHMSSRRVIFDDMTHGSLWLALYGKGVRR